MREIHNLFTRHRLEWTARLLGRYNEEMVREFYASYEVTLDRRSICGLTLLNRPHWSKSMSGAYRLIFPCHPFAGFYTARVLMLLGPLSLPSLTTASRLLKMASSCASHR